MRLRVEISFSGKISLRLISILIQIQHLTGSVYHIRLYLTQILITVEISRSPTRIIPKFVLPSRIPFIEILPVVTHIWLDWSLVRILLS